MNTISTQPFSLLVKPAGADCNLRCKYCFYIDHLEKQQKKARMTDEVLKQMISSYLATPQPLYSFGWQGGEPTLMGVDFFKKVVTYQQQFGTPGMQIANGLQTNATLITAELAQLFFQYKFLVGVSLDGPPEYHNHYRTNAAGKPSHADVIKGISMLQQHKVEFNILALINDYTVQFPAKIYHYFKEHNYYYQQYIPCVEFTRDYQILPYSITGNQWGDFLCHIFDLWYPQDTRTISIRFFDAILNYLLFGRYDLCQMATSCNQYYVVEHDGNVYPCDFFVEDRLKLGNVLHNSWDEIRNNAIGQEFAQNKMQFHSKCDNCPFISICNGGCQKYRPHDVLNPITPKMNHLCGGLKKFYTHTLPRFQKIAKEIARERKIAPQSELINLKFRRNAPCPCGSGKKYKNCCYKL